jgi:hypothetical protein
MGVSIVFDGMRDGISLCRQSGYRQEGENAMPKWIAPLSDIQVKNAKPKDSDYTKEEITGHGFRAMAYET